ncbi:MAG TPA: site-specific integrase [Thermodesulfobacteriota bacterium]|nr:site-specific integrase [Thermodesulfobacteriota bacterium]
MGVYLKGNRWYIDYYLPDGRRKREVVGTADKITRTIAEKALKARVGEIVQGKFNIEQTKKPVRMNVLFDRFLEWAKTNYKNPAKTASAVKPLRAFFGDCLTSELNLWSVEKYKAQRKAGQKKPETVNRELGILRRVLNLAVEWKSLSSNPIQGMKLLKVPKYIPRVLKEEEFQKLYDAASPHFKPILLCAYLTGMRRSEIVRLRWQDVDFESGYIFARETKNNEDRAIPFDETLETELLKLRENTTCEYVFTTDESKPYSSNTAWKRTWRTALKRSGIENCRFHDLRHTFCSDLIVGDKVDFATVMELTGHKDIRMLKRYTHTREEAKKAAIDKLGKRLSVSSSKVISLLA